MSELNSAIKIKEINKTKVLIIIGTISIEGRD